MYETANDKMTQKIKASQVDYNWQSSDKDLSIGFKTSDNFQANLSQIYGHGIKANVNFAVSDNSTEKTNIVGDALSNGLKQMGVLDDENKKAIQTGIKVLNALGLNGNFVTGNDYSGGAAYIEQKTASLSANVGRQGGGDIGGGLSANATYKNFTGSLGVGSNGLPNISAFANFGTDNDTSRSGVNFDIGGRIPAGLVFDIHWSHNGKNYTFPLGSLLTPQGWLYAGGALINNVKTLFGERNGAEYEAIDANTRPMKEPYRELTDMNKDTGEVQLNETGKAVAASIARNMLDNPTAKFYLGQQDKDEARSQKEQVAFMTEIQNQLQHQFAARQQQGQIMNLDLSSLQKNIEIGHPPQTDKEVISANYANVLIVNSGTFHANGKIFQGLTSVAAKNAEKEILQSAEWQEMTKMYDIKGDEQKHAIRLILTGSNAINSNNPTSPAQVIELLGREVYGQGLTMGKIYEEQNLSTHMKRFQEAPEFKAATSNMGLSQADKNVLSMSMIQNSSNNPELNMEQLVQHGIAEIAGKTEKDFKQFKKGAEQYFEALATSPNPIHKMVGNLYSTAGESARLQMTKDLLTNFQSKTKLDKFPDWENAGESQFINLSNEKLMEYAQRAHFVNNDSLNGYKLFKMLQKGSNELSTHYINTGMKHWEAYQELADMNEDKRVAILHNILAANENGNSNVLAEKYGFDSTVPINELAKFFAKNRDKLAQETLAYQQQFNDPSASEMFAQMHSSNQPQIAQAEQVSPSVAAMAQNNQAPAPNVQPEIQQQQAVMEQQQNRQHEMGMS